MSFTADNEAKQNDAAIRALHSIVANKQHVPVSFAACSMLPLLALRYVLRYGQKLRIFSCNGHRKSYFLNI